MIPKHIYGEISIDTNGTNIRVRLSECPSGGATRRCGFVGTSLLLLSSVAVYFVLSTTLST